MESGQGGRLAPLEARQIPESARIVLGDGSGDDDISLTIRPSAHIALLALNETSVETDYAGTRFRLLKNGRPVGQGDDWAPFHALPPRGEMMAYRAEAMGAILVERGKQEQVMVMAQTAKVAPTIVNCILAIPYERPRDRRHADWGLLIPGITDDVNRHMRIDTFVPAEATHPCRSWTSSDIRALSLQPRR